jgi:hypothetical protein
MCRSPDFRRWLDETYASGHKRLLGYSGRTFSRWALCWTLGMLTGSLAFVASTAVELIGELRHKALEWFFETHGRSAGVLALAGLAFWFSNLVLALSTVLLVVTLCPQAVGSGLAQVRAPASRACAAATRAQLQRGTA